MENKVKIQEIRTKRESLAAEIRKIKLEISELDNVQYPTIVDNGDTKTEYKVRSFVYPLMTGLLAGLGVGMTILGFTFMWGLIAPTMIGTAAFSVHSLRQLYKMNKKSTKPQVQPKDSRLTELEQKLEELECQDHELYTEMVKYASKQSDLVEDEDYVEKAYVELKKEPKKDYLEQDFQL